VTRERVVVVGGGAAGHAFVDSYRDAGGRADLVLVTREDRVPYFRPFLTKEYLRGEVGADKLPLDDPDWYGDHGVELRLSCAVEALDARGHSLWLTTGEEIRWDACVLALGSRARPLPVRGADQPGVHSIRSAADGDRLVAAARAGREVVIVGSGFIGCEAAASLQARGCRVTIVGPERVPQEERLGSEVGALLAGWLGDLGVTVRLGPAVRAVCPHGERWVVELEGTTLPADLVVAAGGAAPNVDLAERAGLDVDGGGVVVDAQLGTSAPDVFAVGDIAYAWNEAADRRLRVEHWGDAEGMAEVAAKTLAGTSAAWQSVPSFWSAIGDRTLKLAAWGDGWDDATVRQDEDGFTAWYGRDGATVGVLTHNHDADLDRGSRLVLSSAPFPP
jgi:NADPH-dependent 2,4-dienoyl-CoA reductase/sulfur reductase-like enzyme